MGLLSNKVAVITGSSRGLGLGIAQAYAAQGASLVIASRTEKAVQQAVENLRKQGFAAAGLACDTSDLQQVEALAQVAVSTFGKIDIWVNNAGVGAPYGPTVSIPSERFVRVVQTNILGVYYGSITALKYFLPQNSGKLINLIGRGAEKPVPFQNAYASSKIWVRSFSKSLAQEYKGTGIGVYLFNPGLVLTEMLTDVEAIETYGDQMAPLNTIIRFWGKPPAVPAQKALWLASSATDGKTGLEVSMLTPGLMVGGALREIGRRILRLPDPLQDVHINDVPPAFSPKPAD
jgi:glucose 1-dehydrogenase